MSTSAQMNANRANAQRSTGPKTPEGRAVAARNNFRHGLAGTFRILEWESALEFDELFDNLRREHAPSTPTETVVLESLAQHLWCARRAMRLQEQILHTGFEDPGEEKRFSLYLRYQTTHERAFHQALNQLLKLSVEKRKAEIGFESQQRKRNEERRREAEQAQRKQLGEAREQRLQAEHLRREAAEQRKRDKHKWEVLLAQAKVDNQALLNMRLETPEHRATVDPRRIIAVENAA